MVNSQPKSQPLSWVVWSRIWNQGDNSACHPSRANATSSTSVPWKSAETFSGVGGREMRPVFPRHKWCRPPQHCWTDYDTSWVPSPTGERRVNFLWANKQEQSGLLSTEANVYSHFGAEGLERRLSTLFQAVHLVPEQGVRSAGIISSWEPAISFSFEWRWKTIFLSEITACFCS